jgi:beta-galactosidase
VGPGLLDWAQVNAPAQPRTWSNPSRRLDFHRFTSDSMLEHYKAERDILRRHTPDLPIVTNFMRFYKNNDYWAWAAEEDAAALDIYPDPREEDAHVAAALNFDLMRSLRKGQPWLVMEQATAAVSQWSVNVSKLPGKMRLGSYQAIAQGADSILFFQWRQARGGTERFHSGMVNHAGPDTRVFREVCELGQELKGLAGITGTRSSAKAALVFDWDCWWALELGNSPRSDLNYPQEVLRLYRQFFDANIPSTSWIPRPTSANTTWWSCLQPTFFPTRPRSGSKSTSPAADAWWPATSPASLTRTTPFAWAAIPVHSARFWAPGARKCIHSPVKARQ